MENDERISSVVKFWSDNLGGRNKNLRVVYNNVNGLKIGDYLVTCIRNEIDKKKVNYSQDCIIKPKCQE